MNVHALDSIVSGARRSGRTTRMVAAANAAAAKGYHVVIVMGSTAQVKHVKDNFDIHRRIEVKSLTDLGQLNMQMMRPYGEPPSIEYFYDHWAIQKIIEPALIAFHRYDVEVCDDVAPV